MAANREQYRSCRRFLSSQNNWKSVCTDKLHVLVTTALVSPLLLVHSLFPLHIRSFYINR